MSTSGILPTARHLINKIKVTPRSRGDNVFEGTLYIVDQLWSIHSLDLSTYIWGILFRINQVYQPVEENVWLPLNNIFDVSGSFFGFKFEYKYFTNSTNYEIALNPDLEGYFDVIDDKLEKDAAKEADASFKRSEVDESLSKLASGEEVSRKELRKIMREYEKQERKDFQKDSLEDVFEVRSFEVDSMAYKRDSNYWQTIRPIPLTKYELKGYQVQDSIAIATREAEEAEGDSVSVTIGSDGSSVTARRKSSFEPLDIIMGGEYSVSDNLRFVYETPLLNTHFNTVDGFHTGLRLALKNRSNADVRWEVSPFVRYAFSRKEVNYNLKLNLSGGPRYKKWAFVAEGGVMPFQLNRNNPVDPIINDIWSLMFELNFLKQYERDYAYFGFQKDLSHKIQFNVDFDWSMNRTLHNTTDFKFFNNKNRSYTSNAPFNAEIGDTEFEDYNASTIGLGATIKPWARFRIRNGRKRLIDKPSPTFTVDFKYGIPDIFGSDVDYSTLELGFTHVIEFPAGGVLNINVGGGMFLHGDATYFPEFKHFDGSRLPFSTLDPVGRYRSLEYYTFSTQDKWATAHLFYQFRKLLATQLLEVRLTGAKEGVFLSVLETPYSDHYFEVGYGLNYIFRILRIELVSSFRDFKYTGFGVRVGVAANLETLFE